jgi:alpha-L-arabinofuranosidase
MKTLRILLGSAILSVLFCGSLIAQFQTQAPAGTIVQITMQAPVKGTAIIKIDPDRKIGDIDPNIYSGFIEPIRTTVVGNIYDPSSKFADENGFRKDLIQLLKELRVSSVRWPGGNYVASYNWEDGIGPREKRPVRIDLAWNQIDKNQMGTDEYAKFCSVLGTQNFVCLNGGTGSLLDACHWFEYCNYEKGTYYSDLRRQYGNEKPYGVKYWALGNEVDGPWQMAQKNAEDYCKWALEAAKMITVMDKNVKFIGSGASNYTVDNRWIDWNNYVLQQLTGKIDYLSVHRYANEAIPGDRSFAGNMSLGVEIDNKIELIKGQIENAMAKTGSKRPVYISFDEYSGSSNNLTGSLVLAQHLNSFIRHADIVKMACITMLTSLVGISPDGDYKNPLFYSFYLFSNNCQGTALDVYTNCDKFSNKISDKIPYLDVTAVLNDASKKIVVTVVNRHEKDAITSDIVLQSGNYAGTAKISELNGKDVTSTITKTEEGVKISTKDITFKGTTINYNFPAHSLTQIEIPVK